MRPSHPDGRVRARFAPAQPSRTARHLVASCRRVARRIAACLVAFIRSQDAVWRVLVEPSGARPDGCAARRRGHDGQH
jgi:hypothetical protein